jgi:hypothetical protein
LSLLFVVLSRGPSTAQPFFGFPNQLFSFK